MLRVLCSPTMCTYPSQCCRTDVRHGMECRPTKWVISPPSPPHICKTHNNFQTFRMILGAGTVPLDITCRCIYFIMLSTSINHMINTFHLQHRWFSGKISRCHPFNWTVSASPGFDSRPMHFAVLMLLKAVEDAVGCGGG